MSLSWFENMAIIKIKGYDIHTVTIRDSYDRRAVQYKNNIIAMFSNQLKDIF